MDDLIVGVRYTVKFRDCCIEGGFTAVLVEMDDKGVSPYLLFDNGVRLTTYEGVDFEEF